MDRTPITRNRRAAEHRVIGPSIAQRSAAHRSGVTDQELRNVYELGAYGHQTATRALELLDNGEELTRDWQRAVRAASRHYDSHRTLYELPAKIKAYAASGQHLTGSKREQWERSLRSIQREIRSIRQFYESGR